MGHRRQRNVSATHVKKNQLIIIPLLVVVLLERSTPNASLRVTHLRFSYTLATGMLITAMYKATQVLQ